MFPSDALIGGGGSGRQRRGRIHGRFYLRKRLTGTDFALRLIINRETDRYAHYEANNYANKKTLLINFKPGQKLDPGR